jgi:hypothetical protein
MDNFQGVDTTPEGKAWVAGESEGWMVYNTAESSKKYVFLHCYPSDIHTVSRSPENYTSS